MAAEYDLNTGQLVKTGVQPNTTDVNQTTTNGPQKTVTDTQGTQKTSGTQRTVQSSSSLNTTPAILAALESAILQMTDRNTVTEAELNAKFPYKTPGQTRDASNRATYTTNEEAARFNAEQDLKRQEYKQQFGQIIKGGTADQRATADARLEEIGRNRETQGKYTKEAAFNDAQNLNAYFSRILTEQQLPGILRGAEGSGASQGTTRALLTQQAIARTSEAAAKTGLDAATAYGQVNNQLAATLEALTRQDPNGVAAQLVNAINVSKGIVQSGSSSSNTTTNQTTTTDQKATATKSPDTQIINKDFLNDAPTPQISNVGSAVFSDPYEPSSQAGTGFVLANNDGGQRQDPVYSNYGGNDSDNFFEGV